MGPEPRTRSECESLDPESQTGPVTSPSSKQGRGAEGPAPRTQSPCRLGALRALGWLPEGMLMTGRGPVSRGHAHLTPEVKGRLGR